MDRAKFYADVRASLFDGRLSDEQVKGMDSILDEGVKRKTFQNHLAYMLATTYHETARTMQPIVERGGRAYFNKYDAGTPIGKRLGNTVKGDGYLYRGRGYVQLTGRANYAKASKKLGVDFVAKPDRVMEPKLATEIMFTGMDEGWFTGKDLDDYVDLLDEADAEDLREYVNARRIINGTDKASTIAGYALAFEKALAASGYSTKPPAPAKPVAPAPAPAQAPAKPVAPAPAPAQAPAPSATTVWDAIFNIIIKLFRGGK